MTDKELDEIEARVSNALDVPEPSPLFWEHFPGRVRAAIAASPADAPAPWWKRRALVLAMSIVMVAGLSGWLVMRATPTAPDGLDEHGMVTGAPVMSVSPDDEVEGEDEGWQVVGSVAESAGIETLREAGFGIAPGGAEAAIDAMSDAERAELVTLLRAEMSGDDGDI